MSRMATGVAIDCPCCGATGVPVKFGGKNTEMKARVHAVGKPFTQNYAGAGRCAGPRDVFTFMLAEAKLARTGWTSRYATMSELANGLVPR